MVFIKTNWIWLGLVLDFTSGIFTEVSLQNPVYLSTDRDWHVRKCNHDDSYQLDSCLMSESEGCLFSTSVGCLFSETL